MTARYLADKSALARSRHDKVIETMATRQRLLLIATCPVIDLEMLYSARNTTEYEALAKERAGQPQVAIDPAVTDRALEVQHLLVRKGQHRLSMLALLIAAAAEVNDLVVLHYDADFDRIAVVTGQPTEWVAPKGSLD